MSKHLQRELDSVKKLFLTLSALVEENVLLSAKAFKEMDTALAKKVIQADDEIDRMEIEVEEECLKILALHQPVAVDLRFIVAILKINNDLERIGDLGVNIAKRVLYLATHNLPVAEFDFPRMMRKVHAMLSRSLDALVVLDAGLAREVCVLDTEVDKLKKEVEEKVETLIKQKPEDVQGLLCLLSVGRHLERIADHATNISEDVIYMVEGDIIRHRKKQEGAKEV